jgi:hypothetical protein
MVSRSVAVACAFIMRSRARVTLCLSSTLICLAFVLLPAALAAPGKPPASVATSRLSDRLTALATPELRSAPRAEQAQRLSLPANGPGSLLRAGDDVVVDIRAATTSDRFQHALRAAGAERLDVSARYGIVTAAVGIGELHAVAAVEGVEAVTEDLTPVFAGFGEGPITFTAGECSGAATSEGDTQLLAKSARLSYGVRGAGVKVGILSDSFDRDVNAVTHAADDIASGDLPGTGNPCAHTTAVQNLDDSLPGTPIDEGRAMTQIVHDLAPHAPLAFATTGSSETSFANSIRAIKTAGARVIVDDVFYLDEPFFQKGPSGVAVDDVTSQGAVYYSATGNDNAIVGGNNVGSWEAASFRGTSCPTGVPTYAVNCMDFNPTAGVDNTAGVTLAPGGLFILDLQWAEPWFGVNTNLDVYLLNSANAVIRKSEQVNPGGTGTQKPFELLGYQNTTSSAQTLRIVINKRSGSSNPRLKYGLLLSSGISAVEYPTSAGGDVVGPAIFGHSGIQNAMGVAAIPFNDSNTIEPYSSRGPVTLYFGPVNGTTPASPLGAPLVLAKPDVAATDGVATTFFHTFDSASGVWRFFGTSASAPHAAAVAALQLDGFPSATVAQVKNAQKNTAAPVDSFTAEAAGSGRVNAKSAVANLLPSVTINDVSATEGNSGTKSFTFQLQLSKPNTVASSVKFSTVAGSASAGSDYVTQTNQTVSFPAGATTRSVVVTVNSDTVLEPNETFSVKLSKPVRMKLADATGVGTILNDD